MAAVKTNNQVVAQQQATQEFVLSQEEYDKIMADRAKAAAAVQQQAPAPQAAPQQQVVQQPASVQQTAPQQQATQSSEDEKKAKMKKAGKTVVTVAAGAGIGAAVTAGVFLLTKDDKAANEAGEAAANICRFLW